MPPSPTVHPTKKPTLQSKACTPLTQWFSTLASDRSWPEWVTARDEEPGPVPVACSLPMQRRPETTYYKITGCESGKGLSDLLAQLLCVLKGLHPRRVSTQTSSFITQRKRSRDSQGMQRKETMARTPAFEAPKP